MNYSKIKAYLLGRGRKPTFVDRCLGRIDEVEEAFGKDIEKLVFNDESMKKTLTELEWRIGKNDLDNYQNVLRHYYEMIHGEDFPFCVFGNRRLKN